MMRDVSDDRHNAADLLIVVNWIRPRPRRFAADVDQVGSFGGELLGANAGGVGGGISSGVAKAVRRDVEHAHDQPRAPPTAAAADDIVPRQEQPIIEFLRCHQIR